MVPIKGEWTPFVDFEDQLEHYRQWGLIPEKAKQLRPIMVTDGYWGTPEPCKVVGYQTDTWAVIELSDGYHAIYGEYLAELQPEAHQKLPRGTCFVECLSEYVSLDIETTGFDFHNDRIIEIAAIKYRYGEFVDKYQTLINPEKIISPEITKLTGITQDDVMNAPYIDEIKENVLGFIGQLPIIGHNAASFDIPFLSAQMDVEIANVVIDTLPMARKAFPLLPCHKLEYLKNTLQFEHRISHRALADAETANSLMWACLTPRKHEQKVWKAYLDAKIRGEISIEAKNPKSPKKKTSAKYESVDIKSITPSKDDLDQSHPLYGKNIVFTGTLSIPREDAMQLAVDCGAMLKTDVSGKTHYLVVGKQDKTLVGEDGMSSKEEKAHKINQSGKTHIEILSENEFIQLATKEGAAV